ncbi:MAG: SsrA-binding protein SmpB [Deltaproteobacteria bacterium]|jgi:SsrA-binding protein|nr:SsrA-binding protein SmpB [Deltaproteobacteria bacterium]
MSKKKGGAEGRVISTNRRATFDYTVEDSYEAGLVLTGTEVKSLRAGGAVIHDGFVEIKDDEAWLMRTHIPPYSHGNRENHEPNRKRKLLLSAREIAKIKRKTSQQGFTAFAISLYFSGAWVKLKIGVGRGKKSWDRREDEKEKSSRRELRDQG